MGEIARCEVGRIGAKAAAEVAGAEGVGGTGAHLDAGDEEERGGVEEGEKEWLREKGGGMGGVTLGA